MQVSAYLMLFLAAVGLLGCGKSLSRPKAKELIVKKLNLPQPVTCEIQIGRVNMMGDRWTEQSFLSQTDEGRTFKALSDAGLERIRFHGTQYIENGFLGKQPFFVVTATFTDNAKPFVVRGAHIDPATRNEFAVIRACETQFGEVTGIALEGDQTAHVEYSTKFGDPTPFGKVGQLMCQTGLQRSFVNCDPANVSKGEVVMRRYDDGWRIEE